MKGFARETRGRVGRRDFLSVAAATAVTASVPGAAVAAAGDAVARKFVPETPGSVRRRIQEQEAPNTAHSGCSVSPEVIPFASSRTTERILLYPNRKADFLPHSRCQPAELARGICCPVDGNGSAPRAVPGLYAGNTRPK
jgi:hypothetical protein